MPVSEDPDAPLPDAIPTCTMLTCLSAILPGAPS